MCFSTVTTTPALHAESCLTLSVKLRTIVATLRTQKRVRTVTALVKKSMAFLAHTNATVAKVAAMSPSTIGSRVTDSGTSFQRLPRLVP